MRKVITTFVVLTLLLNMFSSVAKAASTLAYADVPETHWAYSSIQAMAEKGIMQGLGGGMFMPEGTITRAEFIVVITRTVLSDYMDTTIKDTWYTANYKAAVEAGLIMGEEMPNTAHSMSTPITRYEMARLLARADECINKNAAVSADKSAIKDYADIPAEYCYFVEQAYAKGLLTGDGFGRFSGSQNMTRAQTAVVMERLLNASDKEPPYNRDEFLAQYQRKWDRTADIYRRSVRPTRMPELGEHAEQYMAFVNKYYPAGEYSTQTVHYRLMDADSLKPLPYVTLYVWVMDPADSANIYFVMPLRSNKNGEITLSLNRKAGMEYVLNGPECWQDISTSLKIHISIDGIEYTTTQFVDFIRINDGSETIDLLFKPMTEVAEI